MLKKTPDCVPQHGHQNKKSAPLEGKPEGGFFFSDEDRSCMRRALLQATKAMNEGEVPVGAVLLLANGDVFEGRNRMHHDSNPVAHAELKLLEAVCAQKGVHALKGARLYVTLEPCLMCCGAILHAGISEVVFALREPKTGGARSLYNLLDQTPHQSPVHVCEGLFAEESQALLHQFFQKLRSTPSKKD